MWITLILITNYTFFYPHVTDNKFVDKRNKYVDN